jgi:hypothetical protein
MARFRAIEPATGFKLLLYGEYTRCLNLLVSVGSNVLKRIFLGKAHFGQRGIFIVLTPITRRSDDDRTQSLFAEVKNFVVFSRFKACHRTDINAQQGGTG